MTQVVEPKEERDAVELSPFASAIYEQKYAWKDEDGTVQETWGDTAFRVVENVLGALDIEFGEPIYMDLLYYIEQRKFIPGGRYLYASGRSMHQTQNCALYKAEDSREGWAELEYKVMMSLQTGAGVGVDYSALRPRGAPIKRTGGEASGPISLMKIINETGREIMQGGSRRSAIWAGLNWAHEDIDEFIKIKDWDQRIRDLKAEDFTFPAPMEFTNVSVLLDDEFFAAYEDESHPLHERARYVYHKTVARMVKTAEPGFSIDIGPNAGETLRNACTEVTSADDSDICNLGSINLANIESKAEFVDVVNAASLFLLAGTVYSLVPHEEIEECRTANRRLGLGIMGIHEWLLKQGQRYEPNDELAEWLDIYAKSTELAGYWADRYKLSHPIKTRAIAPTGTIGIIGETTTGIEPVFCVAYKRRYLSGDKWHYQYVIDPTAKRLIDNEGVDPDEIEDAYQLAYNVERRLAFQAWMQRFVDHGISSTINLPYPITDEQEVQSFADMLYQYLPQLRGITVYPDGARGGQPLTKVPYEEAINQEGVVFEEEQDRCLGGSCGI